MKKNGLKWSSFLLVAGMCIGSLVGCSTDGKVSSNETNHVGTKEESGEKPVEISVMAWDRSTAAPGTTNEKNALTEWIQEQVLEACNVKVNFVAVPRSGSDDKVNVMMAGDNAPDVIFSYSQSLFSDFATKGGLADLSDSLNKYGDKIIEEIGDIQSMGKMDDSQYAIMKRRGFQIPRHITYVRQDWCEALNMEIPTTKEELIEYLYAVKEKNPGNVENVVPYAMGGTTDTEKFYLNFVCSYVSPDLSEKDAYIYNENFIIFADGALDGIKMLNQLYNDGIISKDFAVDTTNDKYKQDVTAGNAGFMLDDSTNYFGYADTLQATVEGAQFVPTNCLTLSDGSYRNPTEPLYGMYIMVPKKSQDKADAVIKYLNWLADPDNAQKIYYTPTHKVDDAGVPISPTEEERYLQGFPGNSFDYCIVNDHFSYVDSKEGMVSQWSTGTTWADEEWFKTLYDVCTTDQFLYPTASEVLKSEATYKDNLDQLCIEYVYRLISCSTSDFDSLQKSEYKKLVDAGLEKIFEERTQYYDTNMAKE